jgi:hypothetical protein
MSFWHIGPIKGEYQPEEFTESQESSVDEKELLGTVHQITITGWSPREITISFVVDNLARSAPPPPDAGDATPDGPPVAGGSLSPTNSTDPEEVWAAIQQMQRPSGVPIVSLVPRIPVLIPGWGGADLTAPRFARITSSSIQRTHIKGNGQGGSQPIRAQRATITVTLKEASEIG